MNQETAISQEGLMATALRVLSMDAVQRANSGHPGMPMGMADCATVLFNRFMRLDPAVPDWPDRDRFILSAGHGSMLLYSIHHLLGYEDMGMDQLRAFRQLGARTAGHPEYGHALGIETTTGPLGQGLANAVGMALAERMHNARFGDDLVDHYSYVIAGDGCLMEGLSHEASDLAGHLKLGRLIVLWDDNQITIDGSTELSTSTDQQARFSSCGWHVASVDGHNNEELAQAISSARKDPRPSLIACRTVIGYGAPTKAGTSGVHGAPLGEDEIAEARKKLGWPHQPFDIPADVSKAWLHAASRGKQARIDWESRLQKSSKGAAFSASLGRPDSGILQRAMSTYRKELAETAPKLATRKASEQALEVINTALPNSVGGSADLTGSNNTRSSDMRAVTREDYSGNYIHYGVREHAMASAMNGLSLHGGFFPYGGTFLVFSDYCRPAIRLSALMRQPVTYVMTHDSIGLGEDGPTHQPVEHIASLRAIPNLHVIRPADAMETAEAWEVAALSEHTPTLLCLSRQGLPALRREYSAENRLERGAYLLDCVDEDRDLTLLSSGSEVSVAHAAAGQLKTEGIKAAIVSVPCMELFFGQDSSYHEQVLGTAPRIAVEAGVRQGWDRLLGKDDVFIGMESFGASAPAVDLYRHFGITPERIVETARRLVKKGL